MIKFNLIGGPWNRAVLGPKLVGDWEDPERPIQIRDHLYRLLAHHEFDPKDGCRHSRDRVSGAGYADVLRVLS